MNIKEISLKNFRNYAEVKLFFHEKVNVFLGDNAQGKTNLLEGIYISAFGRSFRFGKDNEMIKFGEKLCIAKVVAARDGREIQVEAVVSENEKGIKINGAKIKRTSELLENILIVVFSPEDLKIVKEDPEKRRRFIDRELCQIKPSYYADLSAYKRVLMQRNALLRENGAKKEDFYVWDSKLSDYGTRLIAKRADFIDKINKISKKIHEDITDGKENLEVSYKPSVFAGEKTKEVFFTTLTENLRGDILKGNTEKGPHKDDIKIYVNGTDIRKYGSQGQQRTAALSLKLAELRIIKEETGEEAILLLDDVLSELDAKRQNFLINSLADVQLFITATEISVMYASMDSISVTDTTMRKAQRVISIMSWARNWRIISTSEVHRWIISPV